jgi:hypothetical protein
MRPQMVSIDLPSAFFSARFISTSSTDDEFSIFAAMVGMAFFSRATAIGDAIALHDLASEGVTANPMYGYDRVLRSMKNVPKTFGRVVDAQRRIATFREVS